MNVILLHSFAPAEMCLPSRCLAMDICVTIYIYGHAKCTSSILYIGDGLRLTICARYS
jgi:hypothetical protein